MTIKRVLTFGTFLIFSIANMPLAYGAITYTPFLTNDARGEGGTLNGQVFDFGSAGEVFELDAFLNVAGQDLNGAYPGTSIRLSLHSVESSLQFSFIGDERSSDGSDVTLKYLIENKGSTAVNDVWFGFYIDPQILDGQKSYFNEAGMQFGKVGIGAADPWIDSWEIDEPDFISGDIINHLLQGKLDNKNAVTQERPDDVALAVGFDIGSINAGKNKVVQIFLSDDGDAIGIGDRADGTRSNFALQSFQPNQQLYDDSFTVSGKVTGSAAAMSSSFPKKQSHSTSSWSSSSLKACSVRLGNCKNITVRKNVRSSSSSISRATSACPSVRGRSTCSSSSNTSSKTFRRSPSSSSRWKSSSSRSSVSAVNASNSSSAPATTPVEYKLTSDRGQGFILLRKGSNIVLTATVPISLGEPKLGGIKGDQLRCVKMPQVILTTHVWNCTAIEKTGGSESASEAFIYVGDLYTGERTNSIVIQVTDARGSI